MQVGTRKGKSLSNHLNQYSGKDLARPWVVVSISDSGVGIPREEWNRVFDKFYQIRRESNSSTGSGLGLSIAKHIVEAHNGTIWVEASSPRGTTLTFAFPQERAPAEGWPGMADSMKDIAVDSQKEMGRV